MSYSFFALLARMKHIDRWSLMWNTRQENIQEHSHMVAVLAHSLALMENRYYGGGLDVGAVVTAALYHDATEIITGDLPTPVKYFNPQLREAYGQVERVAERKLLSMLPPELRPDYEDLFEAPDPEVHRIVKAADKLAAHIKCMEEVRAGNGEFRRALEQTRAALETDRFPALDRFMEDYLPAFALTLDELDERTEKENQP